MTQVTPREYFGELELTKVLTRAELQLECQGGVSHDQG